MTTPIQGAERVHGVNQAHARSVEFLNAIIETYQEYAAEKCDSHVDCWDCTVDAVLAAFSPRHLATILVTAVERLTRA